MASLTRGTRAELRRIHGMLETIANLAEHAELAETAAGGEATAARQYNAALTRLAEIELVSEGFFVQIGEDASWGEVYAACSQVCGYIAPDVDSGGSDSAPRSFSFSPNFMAEVTSAAVGELLREVMPEDMADEYDGDSASDSVRDKEDGTDLDDVESKIAELGGQMQVLAERLHRNDLSSNEVKGLADQLRDLGREQTQLAEEHAKARVQAS
jgi:hypothetical protein